MPQITHLNQLPGVNSLRRATNKGGLYRFLEFNAFRDVMLFVDDFNGDALDLNYWSVEQQGGTGDEDFAINLTAGAVTGTGAIQGDTGTTDNNAVSLIGPIIYKGDNHVGMAIRYRSDRVDDANIEVGFIDAKPGSNASGVTDVDTPTAAFADGAVISFDTDQTITGPAFVTKGSTANQTISRTTLSGITPANTVWMTAVIQLVGNDAFCHIAADTGTGGAAFASHNNRSAAANSAGFLEGGIALAPWVYARTRSTTAKFVDVDYVAIWSYRTAQ